MRSANNACSDILEEDSSNISTNQVMEEEATDLLQNFVASLSSRMIKLSDDLTANATRKYFHSGDRRHHRLR